MVEISPIMLNQSKESQHFLGSRLQILERKVYKRVKWVPLGGMNFNDLIH